MPRGKKVGCGSQDNLIHQLLPVASNKKHKSWTNSNYTARVFFTERESAGKMGVGSSIMDSKPSWSQRDGIRLWFSTLATEWNHLRN